MKDIGSSISIVNEEFLEDTGSTDIQDVLLFTPNTEVAGISGNYSGAPNAASFIPEQHRDSQNGGYTRVRGLSAADLTRNYFITSTPFDTYNTDRIDVQRGANSALFGLGSPGGIVNHTTITPDFNRNHGRVRLETDEHGTFRSSFRVNQILLEDKLAIKVAGLYADRRYEQEEAFELDRRIYTALSYKVTDNITLFGNFEKGNRDRSAVDFVPPNDGISLWLETGKPVFDSPAQGGNIFRSNGTYYPGVNNNLVYTLASSGSSSGFVSMFTDTNSPDPTHGGQVFARRDLGLPNPFADTPGEWMMLQPRNEYDLIRRTGFYANGAQAAEGSAGFFAAGFVGKQLLDRSIFDYRKHMFNGGSAKQFADWDTYQAGIEGTWFEDRLGAEVSFNTEKMATSGRNSLQGLFQRTIYIDPNRFLIATDDGTGEGSLVPNPGFGQPTMGGLWGGNKLLSDRESFRATVFGEIKATDFMEENTLSNILGRMRITGLVEEREIYGEENYSRDKIDYNAVANARAGGVINDVPARIFRTGSTYVLPHSGVNFLNANSLDDLKGANIGAVPFGHQRDRSPMYYDNWVGWDGVGQSFVEFPARTYNLLDNGGSPASFFSGKSAEEIESEVVVAQHYLWNDDIVLMGSWRNDVQKSASVGAPGSSIFPRTENLDDPNFVAGPRDLEQDADEDTTSWSVVVHTPEFLRENLPSGTDISVYMSEASNFQPSAGNVTVLNDVISPISGDTEEKGIIISTMNGSLVARLNWYETGVLNRRFDAGGVSSNEGILRGLVEQLANPDNIAQGFTASDVQNVLPPQGVLDLNEFRPDYANATVETNRNSGDSGTQDFVSEGKEFEITYNPIANWTMLLSVGVQETITDNTYPVLRRYAADFVKPTWVDSSFAQNYFINADSTETLAERAQSSILDPVARAILQDGSPLIEQRKTRINFNTSYRFDEEHAWIPEWAGSVTVGGGYRWQDDVGIGFGVSRNELGDFAQDLSKPIFGGKLHAVDVFLRSSWDLQEDRSLIVQLNVKDLFDSQDLVPVYGNPDGSKTWRFMEGRMVSLAATLEF